MNYGKFFRLNKNLSRIEDGFAIYDYIDLPAYFAPSMDNKMSPKYPISLMITSSSVIFRLHYSAYKIEKEKDLNYPKYYYDHEIKDDLRKELEKEKSGYTTKIAHMEEIVLELPYVNTVNKNLADTIKTIYNTEFPQKIIDKKEEKKDGISTGGRYLEKLIRKRYLEENIKEDKDIHSDLYHSLRRISDGTPSYSTLWLMGLVMGEKENVRYKLTDKKENIVGFLRKLMMDFMFDLKHSDVFQNSAYYQNMYSGLMSDFFFSALMHKCEYYYYRELITDEISKIEKEEKAEKCDNNETKRKKHEERVSRLRCLYAQELYKAEELWIKDIMSPFSEVYFEHYNIKDKKETKFSLYERIFKRLKKGRELFIKYWKQRDFDVWNSWFANPEEEMRRVCFAKKDNQDIIHLCNAETLAEYLELSKHDNEAVSKQMIKDKDNFKVVISQWFLKRYDFKDVMHLHLFKRAHLLFFFAICIFIGLLFLNPMSVTNTFWNKNKELASITFLVLVGIVTVWMYVYWRKSNKNDLVGIKKRNVLRRFIGIIINILTILFALFVIPCLINSDNESVNETKSFVLIIIQLISIIVVGTLINRLCRLRLLANMHVLYPRLIASIAAAWLSIAIGNELFGTFFDSIVSWSTSIWLTVIVFAFVMYEINKLLPHEMAWNKFLRCSGVIIISYMISLIVGMFIINFTGKRFLERSGVLKDFYQEYVAKENPKQVDRQEYWFNNGSSLSINGNKDSTIQISAVLQNIIVDSLGYIKVADDKLVANVTVRQNENNLPSDAEMLRELENIHIAPNKGAEGNHPIAATLDLPGGAKFFILRDFLIQFSFLAMFIGIFIQMLFEEKAITET